MVEVWEEPCLWTPEEPSVSAKPPKSSVSNHVEETYCAAVNAHGQKSVICCSEDGFWVKDLAINTASTNSVKPRVSLKFTDDGQPICFKCQKEGDIAKKMQELPSKIWKQERGLPHELREITEPSCCEPSNLGTDCRLKTDHAIVPTAVFHPPNTTRQMNIFLSCWEKESYASPVVAVRKSDGSLWLCVNYQRLNQKTKRDVFPLLQIDESFDTQRDAKFFSCIDLASGYHQVAPSLTNSLWTSENANGSLRWVSNLLKVDAGNYEWHNFPDYVYVYLDILVFSRTFRLDIVLWHWTLLTKNDSQSQGRERSFSPGEGDILRTPDIGKGHSNRP